jgi:translation initiation factor IF-1
MVKNTTGGSKTKGQARKFVNSKSSNSLRISTNELEVYAQVIKILGGSMCHINDNAGKTLLCHIRGKFRGRSKRDNFIEAGSWLLVGLREWSVGKTSSTDKLEECDILEVYNDTDKNRLINTVTNFNWNPFISYNKKTNLSSLKEDEEPSFEFSDEKTEDYRMLLEAQLKEASSGKTTIIALDEEEIDIDDI